MPASVPMKVESMPVQASKIHDQTSLAGGDSLDAECLQRGTVQE